METSHLSELLGATWFGADLSVQTRARLAAVGHLVDLPDGAIVIREGSPCEEMGIVVHGRIALRMALAGGHDRTILTVEPGDVFGWSAVMAPGVATSTCVTVGPTQVVLFDGVDLRLALAIDSELASVIYQRLLACVIRRLLATRIQLLDLYRPGIDPW
jgi:CRP/FNR family transcriptional regulator, cyclic AMP receptor protein